jgi:hypothetical protein
MSEQDDDELALQRQMAELQVKMEAKQREKADKGKANRIETMLELVVDRLDKIDTRLERLEDVSRDKLAATDQIVECVGSIEQTAQGLEGRMANVERRIEASEVKSVEALKMTGAEMQERLDGMVTNLETQLSKATQALLQVGSSLVSATQSSLDHAVERLQRETVSTVNRVDENVKEVQAELVSIDRNAGADRNRIMHLILTHALVSMSNRQPEENLSVIRMPFFKDLSSLDLTGMNLGCEAAPLIASYIYGNKTLRILNVSSNKLAAEGAKQIAEAVKVNSLFIFNLSSY